MKKVISIVLCFAMLLAFAACGNSSTPASNTPASTTPASNTPASNAPASNTPAAAAPQVVIKISHQNAITHPTQKGLEEFKALLEAKSNGTMSCDIYDSAVLGNDDSNLQQVIANSLDAAMIMGSDIWQGYDKRAMVENLPFAFSTYEEARGAWDGEFGTYMKENVLDPCGGHVVDYWENGFRHFTNNIRALYVPSDCKGIKFRTANNPLRLMMFEEFGSSAIVLAFSELYTAMQQGTVDGEENPLSNIVASSFYEVQKYLSLSSHIYSTSVFVFSEKCWNSLTPEQQAIVTECAEEAKLVTRKMTEELDADYLKVCTDNGMEVNEIDVDAFRAASQPVWDYYESEFGSEIVDRVKAAQKN